MKMIGMLAFASRQAAFHPARSFSAKAFDQQRMIVPGLDEIDGERRVGLAVDGAR